MFHRLFDLSKLKPHEIEENASREAAEMKAYVATKTAELAEQNLQNAALWDESVLRLQPYQPNSTCPKCEDAGIEVTYERRVFSAHELPYAGMFTYTPGIFAEPASAKHAKLHHKCKHCGYTWDTKTADHKEPSP